MANEIQNEPQEQEIDLIDLMSRACRWTGNLIVKVFNTILYFLIRNRYWYLLLLAIIAIVTVLGHKITTKQYTCRMIVETQRIDASDVINLINQWNNNNNNNNIKAMRGCYMLDFNKDGIADKIEDYTGRVITDTSILNKRMSRRFVIEAELYNATDKNVLDDVKTKLFEYLNNDPWVINRNEIIIGEQKNMIARIEKEIAQLDSLKSTEYFKDNNQYKLDKNGGLMMVNEKDKHLYHNDIISLLSLKQSIERNLYNEPFKVIQDFSEPSQEDNNMSAIAKKVSFIILVFGSLIILLIDNRKKIKPLIEKADKK